MSLSRMDARNSTPNVPIHDESRRLSKRHDNNGRMVPELDGTLVSNGIAFVDLIACLSAHIKFSNDQKDHAWCLDRLLLIRVSGLNVSSFFEAKLMQSGKHRSYSDEGEEE